MPGLWYIFLLSSSLLALATAGPRILKKHDGDQDKEEQSDSLDYAAMVDTRDELLIGDTALVLDHIDIDVDEFEKLKKRIRYLEGAMVKHANRQVVDEGQIKDAEFMLHELDTKVMGPFKEHLVALKAQILKPHLKYDNKTIAQISTLVKTAELFLQTAQVLLKYSVRNIMIAWLFRIGLTLWRLLSRSGRLTRSLPRYRRWWRKMMPTKKRFSTRSSRRLGSQS